MTTATPGRRLEKNEFIFYRRISQIQYVYRSQNLLELNMLMSAFSSKGKYEKLASVVNVLQNTKNLFISRC